MGSYQLTCRRKGWRSMDTAPFEERVLVRVGRGITIGQRAAFFGPDGSWADDYASPVSPDGWLPLPDVDEEETIDPEPVPRSLKDFVVGDLESIGCPVPWDLLKDSPVSVEEATALAFLLDLSVSFVQNIDRKYWAWLESNG